MVQKQSIIYIMRNISTYISEKLKISSTKPTYAYFPENKDELIHLIKELIKKRGRDADLNDIDTSEITDMSFLFDDPKLNKFCGDISEWDVSNVINMACAFLNCTKFDSDLSNWNVFSVTRMNSMFDGCKKFNSDLSYWDVSKVKNMNYMFKRCENFNSDLSRWNVSNVTNMYHMFDNCKKFNQDLSKWNIKNGSDIRNMFDNCTSLQNKPEWYKE